MRELIMALSDLENKLVEEHGVSLKEAIVLCSIGDESVISSVIAERTGMRAPNASKVIGVLENRKLLTRKLGKQDKRQIYLSLTPKGKDCLAAIKAFEFEIPPLLQPVFDAYQLPDVPRE